MMGLLLKAPLPKTDAGKSICASPRNMKGFQDRTFLFLGISSPRRNLYELEAEKQKLFSVSSGTASVVESVFGQV